ncbi:hypothetical protein JAAARDRAFT_77553 [Jaapia argillacea MUCL 33604]|uniref:PhoD-like phosphatase domain-containing protein n=1 Tax=Jaapia argillacea MUCL 33604 TaxID=933084 RepID=A0A067PX87_9AGAM|nr:hypothetical protein JAAARDRAFT_77553 [Jaapia argillacea MUCL 33604]
MDNPGWRAAYRAQKEDSLYSRIRGPDGRFQPVEQIMPMEERFIGGFNPPSRPTSPTVQQYDQIQMPTPSFPSGSTRPESPSPSWSAHFQPPEGSARFPEPSQLTHMTAVERSQQLRVARMDPHLQFMVGPLLRYDTVENGVWNGAAMIVTSDAGSTYEPHPILTYEWDPDRPSFLDRESQQQVLHKARSFELPPHPADPHSPSARVLNGSSSHGPNTQRQQVPGHEIWVYAGNGGTFTFWRFMIQIPLGPFEMKIRYSINKGQELDFHVPAYNQNMRWATHSCNGFSAGINPDTFCGPGFQSGYDPCWVDLLSKHAEQPFHALVGGGDQIYCDIITREPELQDWVNQTTPSKRKKYPLSEECRLAIDRFFFNHYCQHFRSGAFARANCSIPMVNMLDPEDLQLAPVFRRIGARGYFFFLIFQCFINPEVDGTNDDPGCHSNKSLIIGVPGPYIPFPSHSFLTYMGPTVWLLMLDCRAERRKDQVCSQKEYEKVFARLRHIPQHVEHLVIQLGIPIAYPRMNFMETMLESRFNPLVALGKSGSLGLKGFVNKFNSDAELLDDLNDHWTARGHKKERNWLIEQLQRFAKHQQIRVSFLSGDVHCCAVGLLKTLTPKSGGSKISNGSSSKIGRVGSSSSEGGSGFSAVEVNGGSRFGNGATGAIGEVPPAEDWRYMLNVVSSAIVNTPPPGGVLTMVNTLASRTHKTMHYCDTDETMIPLFSKDTNGATLKNKYIMGRRNWCSVWWEDTTGELVFDIRVEKEKGCGESVGYAVSAPPPRWIP